MLLEDIESGKFEHPEKTTIKKTDIPTLREYLRTKKIIVSKDALRCSVHLECADCIFNYRCIIGGSPEKVKRTYKQAVELFPEQFL